MSFALRILAVVVFVLAVAGVGPMHMMTPLGLALWCASTLPPRSGAHPG